MAARLRSGPRSGLIDGDPGLDQEAIHQEREWNASMSPASSFKDLADPEHVAAHQTLLVRPHRLGVARRQCRRTVKKELQAASNRKFEGVR